MKLFWSGMYVSAPADPSPPSTSNFIPEFPRRSKGEAGPPLVPPWKLDPDASEEGPQPDGLRSLAELMREATESLEDHVFVRVERFDRRGTEPFEPFEFFQNRNFPEFFLRKFKKFRKFQHFLNYRRNSDKISSKSEQKSMKSIRNNVFLQNFAEKCEKV